MSHPPPFGMPGLTPARLCNPGLCWFLGPWPSLPHLAPLSAQESVACSPAVLYQMHHILLNLILNTWSATWTGVPHGHLSQRSLVSSYEPSGTFPVGWRVRLASHGQGKAHLPLRRTVLQILSSPSPKETGPVGGSSQALRRVAGGALRPPWLGHCLWF